MVTPHPAARVEDAVNARLARRLQQRGWNRRVLPFTGYGGVDFARVLARVVMSRAPDGAHPLPEQPAVHRGIRMFFAAPVAQVQVTVRVGAASAQVVSDRGGYFDLTLHEHGLAPGWHEVHFELDGQVSTERVQIISPQARFGIISDIDDTCLVTMLPRPMLAAYNSLVLHETARRVVPGMAAMYRSLLTARPGSPIIYLSTGAWNTQPTLQRFMRSHGYPDGAMLLTDWGPTEDSWFRNGPAHKRRSLERLMREFPRIRWLLVGDDGQRDPSIYGDIAQRYSGHVEAIAIRQLTVAQQLLSHGSLLAATEGPFSADTVPSVEGPDGYVLHRLVSAARRRRTGLTEAAQAQEGTVHHA